MVCLKMNKSVIIYYKLVVLKIVFRYKFCSNQFDEKNYRLFSFFVCLFVAVRLARPIQKLKKKNTKKQ